MPPFTAETARKFALLSHAETSARFLPKSETLSNAINPQTNAIPAQPEANFTSRRLTRVREQLERLDRMAAKEDDPKRIKELADATTRLSEQERILDGRPMPGSRRPTDKVQRAGTWGELQPALPQVAPVAQVAPVQPPAPVQPARPLGWEYEPPKATP